MVYCGKPSQGCLRCRSRKIKCDEVRPACNECTKRHSACPGYRDPLALTFRDQSQETEQKVRSRQPRKAQKKHNSSSIDPPAVSSEVTVFNPALSADTSLVFTNPSWPIGDQAAGFFIHNYVSTDLALNGPHLSSFSRTQRSEILLMAMISIGLAGLSSFKNAPSIAYAARLKYATALRRMNATVQDPEQRKTDSTLMAAILLSMFEIVASSSFEALFSSSDHIDGVVALLKVRGTEQFQHEIGLRMFTGIENQILLACFLRRIRVPCFLQAHIRQSQNHNESRKSISRLDDVSIQACNIRAEMKACPITSYSLIILKILELDDELRSWGKDFFSNETYSTIQTSAESDDIYEGLYYVFKDIWNAAILIHHRTLRIQLNETILECLAAVRSPPASGPAVSHNHLQARSCSVMLQSSKDICSGVPFFLGYTTLQQSHPKAPPQAVDRYAHGVALLWPLLFAGRVPGICDMRRQWIVRRLEKIGCETGIHQALGFASALRRPCDPVSGRSASLGDEWAMNLGDHIARR